MVCVYYLAWGLCRGVTNTCPDLELLSSLMDTAERARSDGIKFFGGLKNFSNPIVQHKRNV